LDDKFFNTSRGFCLKDWWQLGRWCCPTIADRNQLRLYLRKLEVSRSVEAAGKKQASTFLNISKHLTSKSIFWYSVRHVIYNIYIYE